MGSTQNFRSVYRLEDLAAKNISITASYKLSLGPYSDKCLVKKSSSILAQNYLQSSDKAT